MTKSFLALTLVSLAACDADPEPDRASKASSTSAQATELARASAVLSGCMGIPVQLAADVLVGGSSLYFGPMGNEAWRSSYVSCLAGVDGGCSEASTCGVELFEGPCEESCEDGVLTRCGPAGGASVGCDSLGGMCFAGTDCVPAGSATCTSAGPLTCNGDVLTGCHMIGEEGYVATYDCAADGEQCLQDGTGDARCKLPQADACSDHACTEDGFIFCDGGVTRSLGRCPQDRPCQLSSSLSDDAGLSLVFCGYGDECDPAETPSCDGSAVVACTLGERTRVDCSELGFTSCTPGVGCSI